MKDLPSLNISSPSVKSAYLNLGAIADVQEWGVSVRTVVSDHYNAIVIYVCPDHYNGITMVL